MPNAAVDPQLVELSRELLAARASAFQPRCIARAFASKKAGALAFTMQTWIDLDAAQSPLLRGERPDAPQLEAAFAAFGLSIETLDADEALLVVDAMRTAIREGFAAALKMQPPEESTAGTGDDGFGDFAPMLAALVTQCGLPLREARELRVDAAFILIAAMRRNARWTVAGVPYALRDLNREAN